MQVTGCIRRAGGGSPAGPTRRDGFPAVSVDEKVAKLRKLGAEVLSDPHDSPWGRRAALNDPDGHRIEITEPRV
ncbi:MAG: VOC family protein [Deltaproteobacteria bacterium]